MRISISCVILLNAIVLAGCQSENATVSESKPTMTSEQESIGETQTGTEESTVDPTEETAADSAESLSPEDVSLTSLSWDQILEQVAQHKGKVVILDLWSTSCQPCLREFPNLVELSQKYPKEVVCLSCSTDYVGISSKPPEYYEERVRKFLSTQNASFDNYLCTEPADELFLKIDLASIPAVYIFGTNGELVERFDNDEQKYGDEFTYSDHIIPKLETLLSSAE